MACGGHGGRRKGRRKLVDCPLREIFFCGTRGGGKTDGVINQVLDPAAFLSVTVLAVNLLGDRLRDALDPRTANGL